MKSQVVILSFRGAFKMTNSRRRGIFASMWADRMMNAIILAVSRQQSAMGTMKAKIPQLQT